MKKPTEYRWAFSFLASPRGVCLEYNVPRATGRRLAKGGLKPPQQRPRLGQQPHHRQHHLQRRPHGDSPEITLANNRRPNRLDSADEDPCRFNGAGLIFDLAKASRIGERRARSGLHSEPWRLVASRAGVSLGRRDIAECDSAQTRDPHRAHLLVGLGSGRTDVGSEVMSLGTLSPKVPLGVPGAGRVRTVRAFLPKQDRSALFGRSP